MDTFCAILAAIFVGVLAIGLAIAYMRDPLAVMTRRAEAAEQELAAAEAARNVRRREGAK